MKKNCKIDISILYLVIGGGGAGLLLYQKKHISN